MKSKVILLSVLFLLLQSYLQCGLIKNIEMMDSLVFIAIQDIGKKINLNIQSDTLIYDITPNDASWLITKHLSDFFAKQKIILVAQSTQNKFSEYAHSTLKATIQDIHISYNLLDKKSDLVQRVASIALFIQYIDNNQILSTDEISHRLTDTLDFSQIDSVNSSGFAFANIKAPIRDLSFWNKYLEPVIAVASSVIVFSLFFNLRSK